MKNTILKIIVACAAIALVGCTSYSKLVKRNNPREMYVEALKYFEQGKYQKSMQLLEQVQPFAQSTNYEDSVKFYLASSYYQIGYFESSAEMFNSFRITHTLSPFLEEAEYMYAKGFYYMASPSDRDQANTNRALIAMEEYLNRYPESVKKDEMLDDVKELTQRLHDKAYYNAMTYYKIEQYKAAIVSFRNVLNKYPDTDRKEDVLYYIVKSSYLLAKDSVEELQRDRYIDTTDSYYTFVSLYPESAHKKELDKIYEATQRFLGKLDSTTKTEQEDNTTTI